MTIRKFYFCTWPIFAFIFYFRHREWMLGISVALLKLREKKCQNDQSFVHSGGEIDDTCYLRKLDITLLTSWIFFFWKEISYFILPFFFFFLASPGRMWNLSSPTQGSNPSCPSIGSLLFNQWSTRSPYPVFKKIHWQLLTVFGILIIWYSGYFPSLFYQNKAMMTREFSPMSLMIYNFSFAIPTIFWNWTDSSDCTGINVKLFAISFLWF